MKRAEGGKARTGGTALVIVLGAMLGLALLISLPGRLTEGDGGRDAGGDAAIQDPKPGEPERGAPAPATPAQDGAHGKAGVGGPARPAPTRARAETTYPTDDNGSLWIEGRVLDEQGAPVPGVRVTAILRHPTEETPREASPDGGAERDAWTDYSGTFSFADLVDGEYEVSAAAPKPYEPARMLVRAGGPAVDLVLASLRDVWVHGKVADDKGRPLQGVRVRSVNRLADESETDSDGSYGFYMAVQRSPRSYVLRYRRDGYREQLVTLNYTNFDEFGSVAVDVTLEPLKARARVSGIVRNAAGRPMAGETVFLFSPRSKPSYRAVSDRAGRFTFPNVEVGGQYRLWIRPKGRYRDYAESNLTVAPDGLTLDVVLKPMGVGALSGQMLDADGNPIPGLRLWLASMGAATEPWIPVTGDGTGRFVVDGVPAGKLLFRSRSFPQFSVSGVDLAPDTEQSVELVLDWGAFELRGRILDPQGRPVAGARVRLSWHHTKDQVRSQSVRTTIADSSGRFVLGQLGPGRHVLSVEAPGYRNARVDRVVGARNAEVVVRLVEHWE